MNVLSHMASRESERFWPQSAGLRAVRMGRHGGWAKGGALRTRTPETQPELPFVDPFASEIRDAR